MKYFKRLWCGWSKVVASAAKSYCLLCLLCPNNQPTKLPDSQPCNLLFAVTKILTMIVPQHFPLSFHFNANLNANAKFDFGTKSVEEVLSNSFDGCNSLLWVECKVGRPQKQPLCQSCTPSALNFPPLHKMQRKSVKRQSGNIQHLFNHTCQNKTIKDGFLQWDYSKT